MRLCENNDVKDIINKDVLKHNEYDFATFCGLNALRIWQYKLTHKTYDLDIYGVIHADGDDIPYKYTICYASDINFQTGLLENLLNTYIEDNNPQTNENLQTLIRTYMLRHNFPKKTTVSVSWVKEPLTKTVGIDEVYAYNLPKVHL